MASEESKHITGLWGRNPQRGPEAESLVRGQAAKPPEAETFEGFAHLKKGLKDSPTRMPFNFSAFRGHVLPSRGKCPTCPCLWASMVIDTNKWSK